MSTAAAIAAVTRTLVTLLTGALQAENPGYRVSTLPPDKSNSETADANRLNLFLFQISPNAAWRNTDLPGPTGGRPPLGLNLSYMLTAYGAVDENAADHHILGLAMQFLNDHARLLPNEIRTSFAGSELENQVEGVRVTLRSLTLEELVRTWGAFMTPYRVSVAYDVAVILIDTHVTAHPAPPVLRRGEEDKGVFAAASLPPLLSYVLPPVLLVRGQTPTHQPGVRVGEVLTLEGERLAEGSALQVTTRHWGSRVAELPTAAGPRPGTLQVTLVDPPPEPNPPPIPPAALTWSPGLHWATLLLHESTRPDVPSNTVPFVLSPSIVINPTTAAAATAVSLTVTCRPAPREEQIIVLVLTGQSPIRPSASAPEAGGGVDLTFPVPALPTGSYVATLKVDDAASLPYRVVRPAGGSPRIEFDPSQTLVIA
jgi:hypothetical protein